MNSFGRIFRVTIFGESHGPQIGVVLDGVPAGIDLKADDFAEDIALRAPHAQGTTARRERDIPHFISGVYEGHTTGAPLTIAFDNEDTVGSDYEVFVKMPRPGHADYAAAIKWDYNNDPRGGGHFSGRLTLPIVAAGVVAKKILAVENVQFDADLVEIEGCNDRSKWPGLINKAEREGDSLGGIIDCLITNVPIGTGEPFWDSLESLLSHAMFAIPGVRGVVFGDGFKATKLRGSEHNDPFGPEGPEKNGAGGINGGLANGAPIYFRVAVKPTSSIPRAQKTWNFETDRAENLKIKGRHDTCFAQRVPIIVEAMAAIVLADLI